MEDVPKAVPGTNKQIFLGAFGKHPGWDDHVEDLGLETSSLGEAKKLFFVQGIGGEIDAGAWEKLDDSQRLAAFKHVFLWQRPGQYLAGRLWSSSDGKGRTRYPMIVCAHCAGVSLTWVLDQVLPRLEQIEQACVTTKSAADVRSILDRFRKDLRSAASGQTTELNPPSLDTAFISRFASRPELGPQQEGWMRILYAVQSQFGAFARGKFNPKSVSSNIRPQQIRVPRAADSVAKGILQWSAFFLTQVDPQTPMLFSVPLEEQWIDVTVGEPASQELFCLRASPKSVPLASEVPYTLADDFREHAGKLLVALQAGRPPVSILSVTDAPSALVDTSAPGKNRFLKWFGGGTALVALAAILFAVSQKGEQSGTMAEGSLPRSGTGEVIVAARPSNETSTTPTPAAVIQAATPKAVNAKRLADEKRRAEEVTLAEEKARTEAAARLKAIADEQESIRVASEAEKKRLAAEQQMAETKRAAQEKARAGSTVGDLALLKPGASGQSATAPQSSQSAAGHERTNGIGMIFLPMPAGYWVGKHEVTQAQFEKVLGRNPSAVKNPSHPVGSANWADAIEFCTKLTALEHASHRLEPAWAYALPTEAQWSEFSAETELTTAITSLQRAKRAGPEPVGSMAANKFGLHDVRGNVWEWCVGTNDQKVLRGGGFEGFTATGLAPTLALHYRWLFTPDLRKPQAGFRCVLAKQP